jgi:putative two-component system response regulator
MTASSAAHPAATVLVVVDNPAAPGGLADLLFAEFGVQVVNSGAGALALASRVPYPDLILLDVMMPGTDGYEVLRRLRELPHGADIPVIFVTATDSADGEERAFELGIVDYVTKPVQASIVRARVRAHIELKQARDRLRNRNASLEAEVAKRMRENELAQDVSIQALARLAETRDSETGNHLRRTQAYVRALATQLSRHPRHAATLTARVVDLVVKSAPLHDIGKVGIPDSILLKPGRLTDAERAVMRTHARLGAQAIERAERDAECQLPFLAYAKEIAAYHHENYDGSGYPDGLAGDAIPLHARLMALADVFDALITRRTYKAAIPIDQARAIILADRAHKFDPDVVDAFVEAFDAFHEIARRYGEGLPLSPDRAGPLAQDRDDP